MEDDGHVQFGCLKCKRTKRSRALDVAAEKTMLQIFESAFELIEREGGELGVPIPQELRYKLLKWGVKQSIFPPDAGATEAMIVERNKLD